MEMSPGICAMLPEAAAEGGSKLGQSAVLAKDILRHLESMLLVGKRTAPFC
jgi:hypothetical protein